MSVETKNKALADDMVRRVGLSGQTGVAVVEGFVSAKAGAIEEALGDVIPGISALVGSYRRTLLVTDTTIHVFKGSAEHLGKKLADWSLTTTSVTYDGTRLAVGADTELVPPFSPRDLELLEGPLNADFGAGLAARVLQEAGIKNEVGLAFCRAVSPGKDTKAAIDRALDVVLDGDWTKRVDGQRRMVVATDRHMYLFAGRPISKPGRPVAAFSTATCPLAAIDGQNAYRLPDSTVLTFAGSAARRNRILRILGPTRTGG